MFIQLFRLNFAAIQRPAYAPCMACLRFHASIVLEWGHVDRLGKSERAARLDGVFEIRSRRNPAVLAQSRSRSWARNPG